MEILNYHIVLRTHDAMEILNCNTVLRTHDVMEILNCNTALRTHVLMEILNYNTGWAIKNGPKFHSYLTFTDVTLKFETSQSES